MSRAQPGEQHRRAPQAERNYQLRVMGREVAVNEGRLDFGTWERISYGELDGQRRKRVLVKTVGE
jgi:thiamine phosphate synthase YjbQ (UPF0047 family)